MLRHPRDLSVALIGCGRIAEAHLDVVRALPDCHLVAAVDVRPDAAESVAQRAGARAFSDYREALDHVAPDAVIVCTPPFTHAEIASTCLTAGVHVLCEKPLAISVAQAERMVEAAAQGDALLMMASKFRYVRDINQAKNVIEAGLLGEIVLYENIFCSRADMRDRWYSQRTLAGGGVLIDNGSHALDIARFLLGPISQIQGQEGKNVQGLEVEDTVQLYFRTATDVMGTLHLSWSIPKELDTYINVYGTEGQLSIGWRSSQYRQSEKLHWVTFGEGYRKHDAMKRQMQNFVDAINGVDRPVIEERDALESVRAIETAYRSLAMNKWLPVENGDAVVRH
jgi:predicted dehydrogenase